MTTVKPHGVLLVTAREAAAMLAISERKLWTLTNKGDIPRIKLDRAVRYSIADLQAFVSRQRSLA